MEASGILQVEFSAQVSLEAIKTLRSKGISAQLPQPLLNLLRSAGGQKISPVYEISAEEIVEDKYGFARSFTLDLSPKADINQAKKTLENSPLIKTVGAVSFTQSSKKLNN